MFIWGLIAVLTSCGKDYAYRIDGVISNLEEQTLYVVFENENQKLVDTVVCEKPGHFRIEQMEPGFNSATVFYNNREHWVTAYLEPGLSVEIEGDANSPLLMQVKGGRTNNKLTGFKLKNSELLTELTDLSASLRQRDEANTVEQIDITARLADVNMRLSEEAIKFVKENPDQEASVVLIHRFFSDPDDTRKIDELLALIDPKLKDFHLVGELEHYSARVKRTSLGAEAPEFSLRNIHGKNITLESFTGKYLLLAFTAPWCDMCHTEDLYLDKVATTYSKDDLDILLISLDDNPENVRRVLSKEKIDWNLVTDSAGQATMMIDLYNVNALPRCFLIDEDHKILMKTDNGVEVKRTLESLFDD